MILFPHWEIKNFFTRSIPLIFLFTACQTTRSVTDTPTIELFDLYYSPTLGYISESVSSCMTSLGMVAPYFHEQSTSFTDLNPGDVILTLGEADWGDKNHFTTKIKDEKIIFIVNGANPVETIDMSALIDIISGKRTSWQSVSNFQSLITVWVYPDRSDLTDWILETILAGNKVSPASLLAPNPGAVMEAVSKDAGAIGFIPESWLEVGDSQLTNKVKVLDLNDPDEEKMSLPVLAYLSNQPMGAIREFLICLQAK